MFDYELDIEEKRQHNLLRCYACGVEIGSDDEIFYADQGQMVFCSQFCRESVVSVSEVENE